MQRVAESTAQVCTNSATAYHSQLILALKRSIRGGQALLSINVNKKQWDGVNKASNKYIARLHQL